MTDLTEETGRRLADSMERLSDNMNSTRSPNTSRENIDRNQLDNNEAGSRQRFTTGVNSLTDLFGKLAAGSLSTGDAFDAVSKGMNKFGTATGAVGDIFNQLGKAAIAVNDTLKETGRYGVTFGNDLGLANQAIKDAHLTLGEFADVVGSGSQYMAGLSSTMDKSAKAYLAVLSDVTTSEVGRDLRAMGMSAKEMAEITQLSMSRKRIYDKLDEDAKVQLVKEATRMAEEFAFISEVTGKNRKQLIDEQRKAMESTEVLAATLQYGPKFKADLDRATTELSPLLKRVVAEEATGGVRTEEGMSAAVSMGPAYTVAKQLAQAVKEGADPEKIKELQIKLQAANAENIEKQASATRIMGDSYESHGKNLQENYGYVQAIAEKQEEMRAKGQEISKEEAHRLLEKEGKLKAAGRKEDGTVDEGAITGRAINQIDYLGKVAGSVAGEGLKQLNDRLGHAAKDSIPAFEKALNDFATGRQAIRKGQELGEDLVQGIKDFKGKGWKSEEEEAAAEKERKKNLPKFEDGTFGVTGKHIKDFGQGTEVELHGKEAVLTEEQFKNLYRFFKDSNGVQWIEDLESSEVLTAESPMGKQIIEYGKSLSQSTNNTLKDLGVTTFGKSQSDAEAQLSREKGLNTASTQINDLFANLGTANKTINNQTQQLEQYFSGVGFNPRENIENLVNSSITYLDKSITTRSKEPVKKQNDLLSGISDMFYGIGNIAGKGYDNLTSTSGKSKSAPEIGGNVKYLPTKPGLTPEEQASRLKAENTPEAIAKRLNSPERIEELMRVAKSGMTDPSGKFQHKYNPEAVAKAEAELAKINKNTTRQTAPTSISTLGAGSDAAALKAKYSNLDKENANNLKTLNPADAFKTITSGIKDPLSGKADLSNTLKDWQSNLSTTLKADAEKKAEPTTEPEKPATQPTEPAEESAKSTESASMSDIKEELVRLNSSIRELISHTDKVSEGINRQVKATKGLSGNLLS